jgi:serine protease AprX
MRHRYITAALIITLGIFAGRATATPKVDPELSARLASVQKTTQLGVILTFHGNRVTDAEVASVQALGITTGIRMANFPIMAVNATAQQIQQMMGWSELRSLYLNAPLQLNLNQTKPLIGIDRLRRDAELTARNGGQTVAGQGITIAINDSGVDGSHSDLTFNTLNPSDGKTIQNVIINMNDKDGLVIRPASAGNLVAGIIPPTFVENVVNSDTNGGHGTHVASIAAGTGEASNRIYQGVAPEAKLVGLGSGAVLFVLGQVASFDYAYTYQFKYRIRVVNCSFGNSAVAVDPDHPVNVATKILHDEAGIAVVFANGNDGPDPNSQNRWASVPWIITAGASTKDGKLAGFSSRGIFGDPVIHPTVLTPGTGGPTDQGFTSAVVAARAKTNIAENGLNDDAEIPAAFLPNYTQISGTSMAAPHLAGVIATILSANPNLSPDEVKALLERTATPLATYDQFEVGAGMANVHAAVDAAFNPAKPYGDFGFTGKGLTLTKVDGGSFEGKVTPNATSNYDFTIPPNARFTMVQLDWDDAAGEKEVVIDNTQLVAHDLALVIKRNGQQVASSDSINLAALFGSREGVKMEFPSAGQYTAQVKAGTLQQTVLTTQPYTITVTHFIYDPTEVNDIANLDAASRLQAYRLVYDRLMLAEGGSFRPDDMLTRIELGRALMFGARVPQYIPTQPSFTDVSGPAALVAESLKREGVMGINGTTFGPSAAVSRLDQAVALVRALRMDTQAKAKANTNVTSGGQVLTDNAQIPSELRGYVQIALDKGLMEAFPSEVKQTGPGQFVVLPGPRFEPARNVKRSEFLNPASKLLNIMFGE